MEGTWHYKVKPVSPGVEVGTIKTPEEAIQQLVKVVEQAVMALQGTGLHQRLMWELNTAINQVMMLNRVDAGNAARGRSESELPIETLEEIGKRQYPDYRVNRGDR